MLKLDPEDLFRCYLRRMLFRMLVWVCSALQGEENKLCKTVYCTLIFVHDLCITEIWVNWQNVLSFYTSFLWISLRGNQGRFSTTCTHENHNLFLILVQKLFRKMVVDAYVYHKYCKSHGCNYGTNLAAWTNMLNAWWWSREVNCHCQLQDEFPWSSLTINEALPGDTPDYHIYKTFLVNKSKNMFLS
jgi:hypothetical protein